MLTKTLFPLPALAPFLMQPTKAGKLACYTILTMALGAASALAQAAATAQSSGATSIGTVHVDSQAAAGGGFVILPPADKGYAGERILSGTKTDTLARDVPQSLSIVTQQQILDQDIRGIGEALRYVPGVSIAQGETNRDAPIFRGNTSTSDFYIDGIRDDTQFFRDLYNIERVEVLKGANGLAFGRGGSGGVINRVTKQANWSPVNEVLLQGGLYNNFRGQFDVGSGLNNRLAVRLTGVYETTDSYRDYSYIERWGLNPTASFQLSSDTLITLGYEHFYDARLADRGIPSYQGRPVDVPRSRFFGDPERSPVTADVDAITFAIEHQFGNGLILRNRFRYADYDKFYQNIFPGAVNASGTMVQISGYNNATKRQNYFNQTDLTYYFSTGSLQHTLLGGVELARQDTDNRRLTAFFGPNITTRLVPLSAPTINAPVSFAPLASDANNEGRAQVAAFYIQDQIELSPHFQAIVGVRYDRFEVDFTNRQAASTFDVDDNLVSPRFGLIYKPKDTVSIYASYSQSYVPRAGEQLASLTPSNATFDPEKFANYEIGAKWDIRPGLAFTLALYRLDRSNVVIPDPLNAARSLLVNGQRTEGVEVNLTGNITQAWSIIASYAYQDGKLTATASSTAQKGARLPQLPKNSFALWNRYDFSKQWGVGLGIIHQGNRFTSTNNVGLAAPVILPDFTRVDGGIFYTFSPRLSGQVNVENIFNTHYALNAHNDNNITPGGPASFRVTLKAQF